MSGFVVSLSSEWSKPHAMKFSGFFFKGKRPHYYQSTTGKLRKRNDNSIPYQSRKDGYGDFDRQLHL